MFFFLLNYLLSSLSKMCLYIHIVRLIWLQSSLCTLIKNSFSLFLLSWSFIYTHFFLTQHLTNANMPYMWESCWVWPPCFLLLLKETEVLFVWRGSLPFSPLPVFSRWWWWRALEQSEWERDLWPLENKVNMRDQLLLPCAPHCCPAALFPLLHSWDQILLFLHPQYTHRHAYTLPQWLSHSSSWVPLVS